MNAKIFVFACLAGCLFFSEIAWAEKFVSSDNQFSVEPSDEWMMLQLDFQNVAVSYGKKGTLATFHISVRDLDADKTIQNLKWEDLFSPEFESISIHQEGATTIADEKARFCIYTLNPGPFKAKMEGSLAGKYMNLIMVRGGKLFSITFKDTMDGFTLDYPSCMKAIRTFSFIDGDPSLLGKAQ